MAENILQQFGTQLFKNRYQSNSDIIEYHSYFACGVVNNEKISGFCHITWEINFSGGYMPLKHIIIGIADEEYQTNTDLETKVPTIKYGVDFLCRSDKVQNAFVKPESESVLLIERNSENRITFVGENKDGTRHGFGVEITYTDTKDTLLYGIWQNGTLKYQYKDKNWVEV